MHITKLILVAAFSLGLVLSGTAFADDDDDDEGAESLEDLNCTEGMIAKFEGGVCA